MVSLKERLEFISHLLTTPGIEEHVNHYEREMLLEEMENIHYLLNAAFYENCVGEQLCT